MLCFGGKLILDKLVLSCNPILVSLSQYGFMGHKNSLDFSILDMLPLSSNVIDPSVQLLYVITIRLRFLISTLIRKLVYH